MNHNRSAHKNNQPPAEKLSPRAPDAERFVLGAILLDHKTHGHIVDHLKLQYFPIERDREILSAMIRLRAKGAAIDTLMVGIELDEAGHLRNDTASYLSSLTEGMPLLPNIEDWVKALKEHAGQRSIVELGVHLQNQGAVGFSVAEIHASTQHTLDEIAKRTQSKPVSSTLTADELMDSKIELPAMAVEGLLEKNALNMTYGAQRSGKTLLMAQTAMAIADHQKSLFGQYRINIEGPVMFIQADDPNRGASLKGILIKSPISMRGKPFYPVYRPRVVFPETLGDEFYDWLEQEIKSKGLVLVVMDSWTTLRPERHGADIVKAESKELNALFDIAIRTNCTLNLIHHESQNSRHNSAHWTDKAGGTFAVTATPAVQVHVSRFLDLADKAPERLVRARGRHMDDETFLMRFREDTLDHELIMAGSGAEFYPLLRKLQAEFGGNVFKPKEVVSATGMSRQTVTRQMEILRYSGKIRRLKFGEYLLAETVP